MLYTANSFKGLNCSALFVDYDGFMNTDFTKSAAYTQPEHIRNDQSVSVNKHRNFRKRRYTLEYKINLSHRSDFITKLKVLSQNSIINKLCEFSGGSYWYLPAGQVHLVGYIPANEDIASAHHNHAFSGIFIDSHKTDALRN